MMIKNNLLKVILLFLIAFTILGCRNEFNSIDDIRENSRAKEFFSRQQNANNKNSDAGNLLPVLEKINNKNEFLSKLSDQKGIPVWEDAFSKSFEHNSSKHTHDDHAHEMLYVPLKDPEKNHLTSILFVENPNDENPKVYSITNDELLEYVNNKGIQPKERESLLLTFLAIDNQVFGERKYSNIPNELFGNIKTKENFKSFTIKPNEESGTHSRYVMSCVDIYHCEGCQGPCDYCSLCVTKYCSYIWQNGESGGGSGTGDGGTSGTGSPGGGTGTGSSNNTPWYLMNPNIDVYAYNTNVRGIFKSLTDFGIVLDEEHMDFLQANTAFSNAIKNCMVNNTGYKAVFVYNLLNEILISDPQPDLNVLASKLNTFYNKVFEINPKTTWLEFVNIFAPYENTNSSILSELSADWSNPDIVKPTKRFKNHTKINSIYNQAKNTANFKQYLQNFEPTFSVAHLLFDIGDVQNSAAIAEAKEPQNYWIKITFNQNKDFANMPKVLIAYTFIHEMIHANIYATLMSVSSTPQGNINWNEVKSMLNNHNYPGLFDYYTRYFKGNQEWQHQAMAAHYVDIMVNFLKQVYGNKYTDVEYKTIVWMGLQGTVGWNKLDPSLKTLYTNTWNTNYWLWEK